MKDRTLVLQSFNRLLDIMDDLREKCPWDKKQTITSLKTLTIEEMYELVDEIDQENMEGIKEELGDILLHLIFYSKIAAEQNIFDIKSVLDALCEKLIIRHPHIYDTLILNNADEVKANWEKIKLKEGKSSVLSGVPSALPAMVKAMRMQDKARQVGFDWDCQEQVWDKVQEELKELQHEVKNHNYIKAEEELGDVFFALINYARFLDIDAEMALEKTNKKFRSRFMNMEKIIKANGNDMQTMTLAELDIVWDQVKKQDN